MHFIIVMIVVFELSIVATDRFPTFSSKRLAHSVRPIILTILSIMRIAFHGSECEVIMMRIYDYYYVNQSPDTSGKNCVCAGRCTLDPCAHHWRFLGAYENSINAVNEASRKGYHNLIVCGCKLCAGRRCFNLPEDRRYW